MGLGRLMTTMAPFAFMVLCLYDLFLCVHVCVLSYVFIHSFILAISIAPLQVHYYSETLPTTARILYRSRFVTVCMHVCVYMCVHGSRRQLTAASFSSPQPTGSPPQLTAPDAAHRSWEQLTAAIVQPDNKRCICCVVAHGMIYANLRTSRSVC